MMEAFKKIGAHFLCILSILCSTALSSTTVNIAPYIVEHECIDAQLLDDELSQYSSGLKQLEIDGELRETNLFIVIHASDNQGRLFQKWYEFSENECQESTALISAALETWLYPDGMPPKIEDIEAEPEPKSKIEDSVYTQEAVQAQNNAPLEKESNSINASQQSNLKPKKKFELGLSSDFITLYLEGLYTLTSISLSSNTKFSYDLRISASLPVIDDNGFKSALTLNTGLLLLFNTNGNYQMTLGPVLGLFSPISNSVTQKTQTISPLLALEVGNQVYFSDEMGLNLFFQYHLIQSSYQIIGYKDFIKSPQFLLGLRLIF